MAATAAPPTPTTVNVIVHTPSYGKNGPQSHSIAVPATALNAIPLIKRHISQATGISPLLIQCTPETLSETLVIPTNITVTFKPQRIPTINVLIKPLNECEETPVYTVRAATDDTVLDLKFLVSELIGEGCQAENCILYRRKPKCPSRIPLDDSTLLSVAGITENSLLRISFILPSERVGHGLRHRSSWKLIEYEVPEVLDLATNFRTAARSNSRKPFLGTRSWNTQLNARGKYEWQSYEQVNERVTNIASGLRALGLSKGSNVGIMSVNRAEWLISDFACAVQSMISVPLYDTLGESECTYIINHAQLSVIICEAKAAKAVLDAQPHCPTLKHIILMDDQAYDKKWASQPQNSKFYTMTFSQLERKGAEQKVVDVTPKPSDVLTICYTSGTTGQPKGVVLTHRAILASASGIALRTPPQMRRGDEVLFSYLPLAHIYERVVEASLIRKGNAIGFGQGDTTKLVEDVQELRPTIFPGVPRVWQRIYDRVGDQVAEGGPVKRALYNRAYKTKMQQLNNGEEFTGSTVWDKIVFKKVADRFGGRLKQVVSGAAPLNPKIAEYIRINFQTNFTEGYGLSETSGASTATHWDDNMYGVVGLPMPCIEVKLAEVRDMEYSPNNRPYPQGEVMFRGPSVFSGYYKADELTREAIDEDGWFATGDIGMWLPDGNLKIIDRKKNLFKLAQGEYLRPEHIESVYKQCPLLANVFVHGESSENYLVAIVVPDPEKIKAIAAQVGAKGDLKALVADPKVNAAYAKAMDEVARGEKLKGFELVKRIYMSHEDFTIENGLLTPTSKTKRPQIKKHFAEQIKAMYKQGEPKGESAAANSKPIKSKL